MVEDGMRNEFDHPSVADVQSSSSSVRQIRDAGRGRWGRQGSCSVRFAEEVTQVTVSPYLSLLTIILSHAPNVSVPSTV